MSAGNKMSRQSIRRLPQQALIEKLAVKIGNKRQSLVEDSLKRLRKKGYIINGGIFPPNGFEDSNGKDAWLLRWDGQKIEFQIKGSDVGVEKHLQKYPKIPVVMVRGLESEEEIDYLLIDQFHLVPQLAVFQKAISRTSQQRFPMGASLIRNAIASVGHRNGSNGFSNGSCKKHAQSTPCY